MIKESLLQKQMRFAKSILQLKLFIESVGYTWTDGDAFRDPRVHGEFGEKKGYGSSHSMHKLKLAEDINLFKNGKFLSDTEDHRNIGMYWESLGLDHKWGGYSGDGNHYSITHNGYW